MTYEEMNLILKGKKIKTNRRKINRKIKSKSKGY